MSDNRLRKVVEVDKATGCIVAKYDSIIDATSASGMGETSIFGMCKKKTLGNRSTCFRFPESYDDRECIVGKANRPCIVTDADGSEHVYWSIQEMAVKMHVSVSTIKVALYKGTVLLGQYKVRRASRIGFAVM